MKERPILMNADMVRAILDGRKTQTRRPIKPQPVRRPVPCPYKPSGWALEGLPNEFGVKGCSCEEVRYPYGQPGDRLWVREPARVVGVLAGGGEDPMELVIKYVADDATRTIEVPSRLYEEWERKYIGWPVPRWVSGRQGIPNGVFKEAARITLEITDVRVERVQDITDDDAVADLGCWRTCDEDEPCDTSVTSTDPVGDFRALWDSLYGPLAWAINPWVWVIEFRRES